MSGSADHLRRMVVDKREAEDARVLARLRTDTLFRSSGRFYWVSDGARESATRLNRMRRWGLLKFNGNVVTAK